MKNKKHQKNLCAAGSHISKLAIWLCAMTCMIASQESYAQEQADSTAQDLQEIVVEASMQSASTDKVVYRPTNRVKNAAQDAIDLLQRMSIPQIYVDPASKSVSIPGGQKLDIFINYLPASQEDLKGMRTADV